MTVALLPKLSSKAPEGPPRSTEFRWTAILVSMAFCAGCAAGGGRVGSMDASSDAGVGADGGAFDAPSADTAEADAAADASPCATCPEDCVVSDGVAACAERGCDEPCVLRAGVCEGATPECVEGVALRCGAAQYGPLYEVTEVECDGFDNDCDGVADEGCLDVDIVGWSSVAVRSGGRVWAFGYNETGALGYGDRNNRGDEVGEVSRSPSLELPAESVQLCGGNLGFCSLDAEGDVRCWGVSSMHGLGGSERFGFGEVIGDEPGELARLPPIDLGSDRAVEISCRGRTACALFESGDVKCWGENGRSQAGVLSDGTVGDAIGEMGDALEPIDLGTGRSAEQVAVVGSNGACALRDDGQVVCWGAGLSVAPDGTRSIVGDEPGEMGDALIPIELGGDPVSRLFASREREVCALHESGELTCWGHRHQMLRQDSRSLLPRRLDFDGRSIRDLSMGLAHMCAIFEDRSLACWGINGSGRLGLGDTATRSTEPIEELLVDLGEGRIPERVFALSTSTCVVTTERDLFCWGGNSRFQLGRPGGDLGDEPGEMGASLEAIALPL